MVKQTMILFKTFFSMQNIYLKITLFCIVIFIGFQPMVAQDVHLTSFNYSPLLVNPANTGNFYGNWRAALNYRNQWAGTGSAYSTAIASGDKLFNLRGQKIGAGVMFINDQTNNGIQRNMLLASGSYFYEYADNHFSGGLQTGIVFLSPANPNWGLYNPERDDHSNPNNETTPVDKQNYVDVNLGFMWWRSIGIFEPQAGIAFAHINAPNQSLNGGTDKIPITSKLHGSLKTKLNDEIYITPTLLVANNNKSTLTVFGVNGGYRLLGNRSSVKEVYGGLYLRNGIASEINDVALMLGTTVGRLDIVLSYDLNMTSMSQSKNLSSFEISLVYKSLSTILNSYSIPCERF
ncbi:MAG TPA: hypothetical protein DDX98_06805 [Bacteroidales bacterium]|jgi:type IX secretion system PorP/SprF family membrane protein|nr:hypothetical protein [Bacteroidales bacterium]